MSRVESPLELGQEVYQQAAVRQTRSEAKRRVRRSNLIDRVWNRHLHEAFLAGANPWMTRVGADASTFAGAGGERYSAWAWNDFALARVEDGFKKTNGKVSAEALVKKMKSVALRAAYDSGATDESMLSYVASLIPVLAKARGLTPATQESLIDKLYQGKASAI